MNIKIEQVVVYSLATKALFEAHYDDLILFDDQFTNPYKTDTWQPKIDAASGVIVTLGLRKLNKGDTEKRNKFMDNLTPILKNLQYKIQQCITAGTITDSLSSFGLGAFNNSISKKAINNFHTAYEVTIAKVTVTANQEALIAKGFTEAQIESITTNHNGAWELQETKIELKEEISDLSEDNQIILHACLTEDQKVINGLRALAESTSNTELKKKATQKAILKSVRPTPAKKPRNRNIQVASSIVLKTNHVAKNVLQLTLKTNVIVTLCRTSLKTDQCTSGITLPFSNLWEGKLKDIPGTGKYIKLTNQDTSKPAKVLALEIVVQKA